MKNYESSTLNDMAFKSIVKSKSNKVINTWIGSLYRPLHTRGWEPITIALQALPLVEKAEPVQVRYFALRLRDQRSMWMQRWT